MIDFTLNKNMVLQIHTVGEEQTPIIVIDDFVNNVDALINFAVRSTKYPLNIPKNFPPAADWGVRLLIFINLTN